MRIGAADPEVLAVEEAADPVIGDGQVLVAVHAAAITFDELTWDLSWETTDGQDRLPVIPAHEMAGVVVRRSPDVDTLGDRRRGVRPGAVRS